jgi:hypothetical protein
MEVTWAQFLGEFAAFAVYLPVTVALAARLFGRIEQLPGEDLIRGWLWNRRRNQLDDDDWTEAERYTFSDNLPQPVDQGAHNGP